MTRLLFRPLSNVEGELYTKIKNKVFSVYSSGHITDKNKIIEICMLIYKEYEIILEASISQLDIHELVVFMLYQYEEYSVQNSLYQSGKLSREQEEDWLSYASHSRRGIKYLLELLCKEHNNLDDKNKIELSEKESLEVISRIIISIEEMCSSYMRIDGYKFLIDSLDLHLDISKNTYFNVPQDLDACNRIDIRSERNGMHSLISGVPYGIDTNKHSLVLSPSFKNHLGLTYEELITFLHNYIFNQKSPVTMVEKRKVVEELQQRYSLSCEQATKVIQGFSVRSVNLIDRLLYSPKQEHRAYHRGFFEFTRNGTPLLVFSKTMALEALNILINNTCYQKLPEDWKDKAIENQLTTLSNNAGKWFEDILHDNLSLIGIQSIKSIKSYSFQGKKNDLPSDVGEIDFIGYFPKEYAIFVIEAKNVRFNTEPRLYRDDLSKFIYGKKSYSEKFIKKCQWVVDNIEQVASELNQRGVSIGKVKKVYKVMVILTPSPVERKISKFSCINMVSFVNAIKYKDLQDLSSIDVDYEFCD
ncbi:hypothetical protein ABXV22_19085 [Vibrio rotiferianus]|uniref:hypothetical protein n=1 Tax=Vibrio rotiferianus TaxID=190895 RepID=UPI003399BD34